MAFALDEWLAKARELALIYEAEPEVCARHLSQHRHFIVLEGTNQPFVCAHAVFLGIRGEDMRNRDGKTQNIKHISAALYHHGYTEISKSEELFSAIWSAYENACDQAGRPPSGGKIKTPKDRTFFVTDGSQFITPAYSNEARVDETLRFQRRIAEAAKKSPSTRKQFLAEAPALPQSVMRLQKVYVRNPYVVVERLEHADGSCGECRNPAPFINRNTGRPFLEVHHIIPLSEGGPDTVDNTIALCPNCHRKAHFG